MKTKSVEALDRLSELPDALILKIFELLPTRDVVRTTVLSRRWKDLWTINPYLCFDAIRGYNNHSFDDIRYDDDDFRAIFDDNDVGGDKNDELRRFVNRALSRWRGARVLKFKVSGAQFDDSIFTDMDLWLRFAVDNRVEELDISFKYAFLSVDDDVEYCPPNCLYSCSSLQKLSFDCFSLKIDGSVQWSGLKSLNIVCSSVSRQGIEGVLCGSPLLEEFLLVFHDKDGNLEFRSSSLKKLSIKKGGHTQNKTGLRIWTPNLLELTVSGVSYDCCVLENVTALARANLLFDWGTFLSESSNLTLAAIQHVEGLTLSDSCFETSFARRFCPAAGMTSGLSARTFVSTPSEATTTTSSGDSSIGLYCAGEGLGFRTLSLKIKGGVEWSRLKSLKIDCSSVTQQMIEQVLSGSPLLEEFSLTFEAKDVNSELSFRSSSLKKLSICQIPDNTESTLAALRIWTPNPVVLTLSGDPSYTNCLLKNVSSLARANLLFDDWTWDDFVGKTLTQILPAIQHVEGLTLSQPCVKVLGAMRSNSLLPPISNVKFLSLYYRSNESENILCLLEIFPKLKTLVVNDDGGYYDSKVKFKPNPSNSFIAELETVEVTWFAGCRSVIFPFIKILLKHASKLKKLVFRVRRTVASDILYLASKELLEMPRSSPRAKLVIHEY